MICRPETLLKSVNIYSTFTGIYRGYISGTETLAKHYWDNILNPQRSVAAHATPEDNVAYALSLMWRARHVARDHAHIAC